MADLFDEFNAHSSSAPRNIHGLLQLAGTKATANDDGIFALDRVQFSFPGSLVAMAVENNMMAVCLVSPATASQFLFWIDLGQSQSIEEIEIPIRVKNDYVRRMFMDPTARHIIISTELGDNFYMYRGWKKPKSLAKFKGHIFECELQASDEYFKREERHFQQIFSMPEDLPVLGIRKLKFPTYANRFAVAVTTPNRIYQFIGTAFDSAESGGFSNLFNYQELPTISKDPLQVWSVALEDGEGLSHKKFAWLTEPGVFSGDFDLSNSQSDSVMTNAELHPVPFQHDNPPLSVVVTEFHYIVLYADHIQAISALTNDLVFEEQFVLEENECVHSLVVDGLKGTYWVYTNVSVYEIIVNDEDRDVWKIYLSRKNFETALTFAKTETERDRVITAQAEHYFAEKRYRLAATYFAQSLSLSFEEVALRFIGLNENGALKQFLLKKSETLKPNEQTQMTILCMWLLELYVHELDAAETKLAGADAPLYTNPIEETGSNAKEINMIREKLRQFIIQHKLAIDIEGAFTLFSSHGRTQEMLFLAEEIGDYERIINHWITKKEWMRALDVLNKQNSDAFFYKFSAVLIDAIPVDLINCWIQHPSLDPKRLLPALLKYESKQQSAMADDFNQAIRYLNHVIQRMENTDASIHNYLLSLYVSLAKSDKERGLVAFLISQDEDSHYDVQYALRLCMKEGLVQSSILIYSKLGLYEQAVDLALKNHELQLAQINADKPIDDEILRKKLWLKIARHVVDERKDIKQAIEFLKQSDLLRIEDILPFFPDFVLIDDFKSDLCQALEEYNEHIEQLKEDMDEATRSAQNIRKDIQNLKNRSLVIHVTEQCSVCALSLLTRQFLVFPCKHVFHSDCLANMLLANANSSRVAKLQQLKKRLESVSGGKRLFENVDVAEVTGVKEEYEHELSSECPLCNEIMIKSVNKPFDVSSKLVVFETRMKVRHALAALVQHGVQSAPLWDAITQQFVGMFTVTDFINLLLHYYYNSSLEEALHDMENLTIKNLKASSILLEHHLYRLPLVDDLQTAPVIVSVVTEFKILRYIAENYLDIPIASKTLRELGLGTYKNLKTAAPDTPLISVLNMFVKDKISAVPIQDENGFFVDIYEKFDILLLTKEGTSPDLSIPLSKALSGRSTEFAGIHTCSVDETIGNILDTIRKMTVHRFIVLEDDVCKGILSL
ncbi:hypothetical protein HDU98_004948 [Podochytrium sp. JEL0797]|nr:hypothetical protein HDU98_004948 [Podochytrium sp. JEL0797]